MLYPKFCITGPSRSVVFVLLCFYQIFCTSCYLKSPFSSHPTALCTGLFQVFSFLLSWSPYAVVAMTNSFADPRSFPLGHTFGFWMDCLAPIFAKTSSCFSAAAFIISNKRYREALLTILSLSSQVYKVQ